MDRPLAVAIATLAIVAAVGCRGEGQRSKIDDERMRAYVTQLEAVRDTLANVDDVAAAKAAAQRLAALKARMTTIRAEIGALSDELQRDVSIRYGETIVVLTREIAEQSRRIAANPELSKELRDGIRGVPSKSPAN